MDTEQLETLRFEAQCEDVEHAHRLAASLDLDLEGYLRRALKIINAETEAFLSTRRGPTPPSTQAS